VDGLHGGAAMDLVSGAQVDDICSESRRTVGRIDQKPDIGKKIKDGCNLSFDNFFF